MVKDFEITCPYCSKTFSGEDLLKDHLAEADKKFKEKEQAILLDAKKNAEAEANKKIKEREQSIQSLTSANKILQDREAESIKKMKKREAELLSQATKKAEAEANKIMREKEKKIEQDAFKKAEIEVNKKLQISEKEKKEKEKEINAAKILLDKKNKEIEITRRKAQKDVEEERKGIDKKLRDLEKKMQQDASERKGENQEQIIEDFLSKNFSKDKIIPIKKGARGADCIQQVNEKGRTNIGRIYYESKDTKEFSEGWVEKLLNDMSEKDINFGIIVTETLPKSAKGKIEFRHNNRIAICPMDWELLWAQANSFREMSILFNKFAGKNTPDDMGKDELWDAFKTGSNYKLITKMHQQYLGEVKNLDSHEKSFNKLKINSQNRRKVFLEFIANLKNVTDLYPDDFLDED